VLVGTEGGGAWWETVTASPEWRDGAPDPLDRWSKRVLGAIACRFGGTALFPSDGPPWPPFPRWALATGRVWQSPVRLLVHAEAGLWVAFRGALALPFEVPLPPAARPCDACPGRPCLAACPAGALTGAGYDVPACRAYLDSPPGADCMAEGCAVRRACPVSQSHARLPAQSAYHMSRFHP
jgi:epoxyqueuosine reductase